jgi:hypothetical protein
LGVQGQGRRRGPSWELAALPGNHGHLRGECLVAAKRVEKIANALRGSRVDGGLGGGLLQVDAGLMAVALEDAKRLRPGEAEVIGAADQKDVGHLGVHERYSKPHVIEKKKSPVAALNASW